MKSGIYFLITFAVTLMLITGCAGPSTKSSQLDQSLVESEREKQREIALTQFQKKQIRLLQVSYPLLTAASGLCEKEDEPLRAGVGLTVRSKYSYVKDMQDTAARIFNLGETPEVLYVVKNSPAERAGIKKGDLILQVGDHKIPASKDAFITLVEIYAKKLTPGDSVDFVLENSGQQRIVTVQTEKQCHYLVALSTDDSVNAFADGNQVIITTGMMRFTETDQELSSVVSHELAHNLMDHMDAKQLNATGGLVLDILAAIAGVNTQGIFSDLGASVNSKEFEVEADYVGLYIMARANEPLDGVANFWRRMAAEHPGAITSDHMASHPSTPERFVAIENTVVEIQSKQHRNAALVPEYDEENNRSSTPAKTNLPIGFSN